MRGGGGAAERYGSLGRFILFLSLQNGDFSALPQHFFAHKEEKVVRESYSCITTHPIQERTPVLNNYLAD